MSAARGAVALTRGVLAATAVAAALVLGARPASAEIFAPADAAELAAVLDEAYQQQGICYGWEVVLHDNYNRPSQGGTFTGSNLGPGTRAADDPRCGSYVVLHVTMTYTSSSSESEDSADWTVVTDVPGADGSDLRDRVIVTEDALVGDRDDVALFAAVASLPLVAAEAGLADPLPPETTVATPPGDARLTGSPGPDFIRTHGLTLLIFGGLLAFGVLFLLLTVAGRDRSRHATAGGPPDPPRRGGPRSPGPGSAAAMSFATDPRRPPRPPGQRSGRPPPGRAHPGPAHPGRSPWQPPGSSPGWPPQGR